MRNVNKLFGCAALQGLSITVSANAVQLAQLLPYSEKDMTGIMEFTLCYRLQYPILNQIRYDVFFRLSALLMQKVSPFFWTF
jgi:hypothetical protein